MSIVAVHGPNTFGSRAVAGNSVMTATVNPANNLQWTFSPVDKTQVAANYDWAYTGAAGSPTSPILNTMTPTVTFTGATPGTTRDITLTLNGVAQPVLRITIPPAPGGQVSLRSVEGGGEEGEITQETPVTEEVPVGYDPAAHTVGEVQDYVTEHPEQLEEMYEAEVAGKNRSTLVTWLEEQFPYDPGAWTVQEVVDYASANPDDLEDIITAEQEGKNRTTLLGQLEAMRE